jgi:hypothetical protein
MLPNIFDQLRLNEDDHKIIPITMCVPEFYTITFEGWKNYSLIIVDDGFMKIMELAKSTVNSFIDLYKQTHAFTQPQFIMKMDGMPCIKIGIMEIDRYEKLMEIWRKENERPT